MQYAKFWTLASLLSVVAGQTPQGFNPGTNVNLNVTFANNVVVTPGIPLPKDATASSPTIVLPGASNSETYTIFMIDMDVPTNTTPTGRTPLLHWWQPNSILSSNGSLVANSSSSSSLVGAPYIQPNPPAGSGPHRYVLTVFTQPPNWSIPSQYSVVNPPANTTARIGFNITAFVAATNLTTPLAGNYFTVENTTATATTSATSSPSASQFTGAANSKAVVPVAAGGLLSLFCFAFFGL